MKDEMSFPLLSWLFAVAITIHNLEEALWLPAWSQSAGRWHHPVGAREFRFAVGVLTTLAYIAACLSNRTTGLTVGPSIVGRSSVP